MIEFKNVSKHYKNAPVLNSINFTIYDGEIVVLIGPSGCGKTTTLKMINRLIAPSGGQILINGEVYNEKDEFPAITNAGLASEPITVGKGQYFVLGDNRNNSEDSRHNGMGLVDSDRIVGKLWFTISPWKKIGFV